MAGKVKSMGGYLIRVIALAAVLCAGWLVSEASSGTPVSASRPIGGSSGAGESIVTRQIRLSFSLPGTTYPRDALVPATVRLTNFASRSISTWDCLADSLGAEVVRSDGGQAYPPLLPPPGAPWAECPGALGASPVRHTITLGPGQTLTRTEYLVLRSPAVQAFADLGPVSNQGKPVVILTPRLRLHTIVAPGPQIHLRVGPAVSARVTPVPGSGPLLYSQFATCRGTASTPDRVSATAAPPSQWVSAPGTTLQPFTAPPCSSLTEWILFVGQVGRPITRAYYCRQHDRCDYAPPTSQQMGIATCKRDIAKAIEAGQLPREAARYAIGLSSTPPDGMTPAQQKLAGAFHARCAPLLKLPGH